MPIPQHDFDFVRDTFNLFSEPTIDGERIARERAALEQARATADKKQRRLFTRKERAR